MLRNSYQERLDKLSDDVLYVSELLSKHLWVGLDTLQDKEMVKMSIDAYTDEDPKSCFEISDRDDETDEICKNASELVVRDLIKREEITEEGNIHATMESAYRSVVTIQSGATRSTSPHGRDTWPTPTARCCTERRGYGR